MKKWMYIIVMAAGLGAGLTACSNNVTTARVPEDVVTSFNQRYPAAKNVKWEVNDGLYKANFTEGNKEKEAVYQSDGDLVRVDK